MWLLIPASLGLAGLWYHEWWRDEAYTWLVVNASDSLRELFQNLGYNGHPRAYYIPIWILHKLWKSPAALSVSNLGFTIGATLFLLWSAPITRIQAALFSVGFYPLYQYGIISRSYSVILFLLFLYCHLRSKCPELILARYLVLAALAQIHLISMAVAAVLLLVDLGVNPRSLLRDKRAITGVATVILSVALTTWQMLPGNAHIPHNEHRAVSSELVGFSNAFLPNFGIMSREGTAARYQRRLGFILFLVSLALLWSRKKACVAYVLLLGTLFLICTLVYSGFRWHHGLYFIFLIVAIWLFDDKAMAGMRGDAFTFLLLVQLAVSFYAQISDALLPYSDGRIAAKLLHDRSLENLPMLGLNLLGNRQAPQFQWEVDGLQPILMELNGKGSYDGITGSFDSFDRHYTLPEFPVMSFAETDRSIREVTLQFGGTAVVVLLRHSKFDTDAVLPSSLHKIADLPETIDYGETYSIYLSSAQN